MSITSIDVEESVEALAHFAESTKLEERIGFKEKSKVEKDT